MNNTQQKKSFRLALRLPLDGKVYNVLFMMTLFVSSAMRELVDVEKLAEHDMALLDRYLKANEKKRSELEEEFKLTPVVAGFIQTAYPDGQVGESKGTRVFRILSDAEFAEATLPPKAELDVQLKEKAAALTSAEEKIKALEVKLAEGSTKKSE